MSADFLDEIEAINSIYGDESLLPSSVDPSIYLLTLPTTHTSLRLSFPASYPEAEPPAILGLQSAGDLTKRGSGARDLAVFTAALGGSFMPGTVCLFDALEETARVLEDTAAAEVAAEEEAAAAAAAAEEDVAGEGESRGSRGAGISEEDVELETPPDWVISAPWSENKSTFVARAARVNSPGLAARYIGHLLASDKKIRTAHHNITAWRIRGEKAGAVFQDCDDDGETAAGGRLLHLMQIADVWDVVVVVTRWYGGLKLGPRRFALINNAGRDALVRGGWIEEKEKEGKKKR